MKLKLGRPWVVLLGLGALGSMGTWLFRTFLHRTVEQAHLEPISSRPYTVITRSDHDPSRPAPVLFALHAYATPPEVLVQFFALETLGVAARGLVLVVPQGLRDDHGNYYWNATRACCGASPAGNDDLNYLRGVLREVKKRYAIDARQVMVLGVSNGGFMAHRWACSSKAELTAIACISGAGPGAEDPPCTPAPTISVLQLHGDGDEVVRYEGGKMRGAPYPSARESLSPYLRAAQIAAGPEVWSGRRPLVGAMRTEAWSRQDARFELWTIREGTHHLRDARYLSPDILNFLQGRSAGRPN